MLITTGEIIAQLARLNYFKYVPAFDMDRVKTNIQRNYRLYGELDSRDEYPQDEKALLYPDRRCYSADAEGLAEQGVCRLLSTMQSVLEADGVVIESLKQDAWWDAPNQYSYHVLINGERHPIYDYRLGLNGGWGLAHKRVIEIINELLAATPSPERLYGQGTGNDAAVILLTEELYHYVRTLPLRKWQLPFSAEDINIT